MACARVLNAGWLVMGAILTVYLEEGYQDNHEPVRRQMQFGHVAANG